MDQLQPIFADHEVVGTTFVALITDLTTRPHFRIGLANVGDQEAATLSSLADICHCCWR
jgi:hypothetical protein